MYIFCRNFFEITIKPQDEQNPQLYFQVYLENCLFLIFFN